MTKKRLFHLKPFSIRHDRSTMKVGMDALLLGVWADTKRVKRVLDIGTGTGIIALLIASRTNAKVNAIEIDKDSSGEAYDNFNRSPFYWRMKLIQDDFNNFAGKTNVKYDLIISNPPFFINDTRSGTKQKILARHGDTLSYGQLISGVRKILSKTGKFCLVLPYDESRSFLEIALDNGLHLQKQQIIIPVRGLLPNRINLQVGRDKPENIVTEKLVIREQNRNFSEEYKMVLKDYLIS